MEIFRRFCRFNLSQFFPRMNVWRALSFGILYNCFLYLSNNRQLFDWFLSFDCQGLIGIFYTRHTIAPLILKRCISSSFLLFWGLSIKNQITDFFFKLIWRSSVVNDVSDESTEVLLLTCLLLGRHMWEVLFFLIGNSYSFKIFPFQIIVIYGLFVKTYWLLRRTFENLGIKRLLLCVQFYA